MRLEVEDAEGFIQRARQAGLVIPFLVDVADRTLRVTGYGPGWLEAESATDAA